MHVMMVLLRSGRLMLPLFHHHWVAINVLHDFFTASHDLIRTRTVQHSSVRRAIMKLLSSIQNLRRACVPDIRTSISERPEEDVARENRMREATFLGGNHL